MEVKTKKERKTSAVNGENQEGGDTSIKYTKKMGHRDFLMKGKLMVNRRVH